MTDLQKEHLINGEILNQTYYFQSLLEEACRVNLLSAYELEKIQLQSIKLLARQTERYTGGESSSVKVETAQSIMQSILYTIGIYLKSLSEPDLGIVVLKEKPLLEVYKLGKQLIEIKLTSAKQLFTKTQNESITTNNYAYNDTLEQGIPVFFSAYDVDFGAHETPASIDYPLSVDRNDLVGIEYICNYLQTMILENQFCQNFSAYDLECLSRGYHDHYEDLLINIFGLVVTNLVGSALANNNSLRINIEPLDRDYLQQKLARVSKEDLDNMLHNASTQICEKFNLSNTLHQKLISVTAIGLSGSLRNALDNNQLATIFVSLKETQPALTFEDGKKIDDESFRSITEEIRSCRYVSDKIAIIKKQFHSIADLVDILEGYCIFDGEFAELFQSLGDIELALLLKKLPTEMTDSYQFTENEKVWHERLNCFFEQMALDRREKIRELADKITLSGPHNKSAEVNANN